MRKTVRIILILFFALSYYPLAAQEENQGQQSYDPAGRRDPFVDLLAAKEAKQRTIVTEIADMSVEDVNLSGIVSANGKLTAIIKGPQGFPFYIKEGDKFSDGYVMSVFETEIILRKTNERGIPLKVPKDVIKEVNVEGR